jgi:hypothetical protein
MNVALHSPKAQHAILSIILPVGDGAMIVTGGDEALLVLFKLAISPLSPQVRGATMSTIASLLDMTRTAIDDVEKQTFLLEQAKHGWEYLESCPLLPIALLDQYLVMNNNNNNNSTPDAITRAGLAFPPSSVTLVGSGKWIVVDFYRGARISPIVFVILCAGE